MGKVYFIGAGPGAADLITVRGRDVIRRADLVLYAGSLVPEAVVAEAKAGAEVLDSSPMTLEETHARLKQTAEQGGTAARVHTGDPSLYGAVREQIALLDRDGIAWEIVPGVTAAFAAAALAGVSFTVPEAVQSLVLCRQEGRTPVPEGQSLRELASHGAAMAVYLSAGQSRRVQEELLAGGLTPATLVVAARAVGWPEEALAFTTLGELAATARELGFENQTVFLVLPGQDGQTRSRLYDPKFGHGLRAAKDRENDKE